MWGDAWSEPKAVFAHDVVPCFEYRGGCRRVAVDLEVIEAEVTVRFQYFGTGSNIDADTLAGRKGVGQQAGLLFGDGAWGFGVADDAEVVGSELQGKSSILYAGETANFDANVADHVSVEAVGADEGKRK